MTFEVILDFMKNISLHNVSIHRNYHQNDIKNLAGPAVLWDVSELTFLRILIFAYLFICTGLTSEYVSNYLIIVYVHMNWICVTILIYLTINLYIIYLYIHNKYQECTIEKDYPKYVSEPLFIKGAALFRRFFGLSELRFRNRVDIWVVDKGCYLFHFNPSDII